MLQDYNVKTGDDDVDGGAWMLKERRSRIWCTLSVGIQAYNIHAYAWKAQKHVKSELLKHGSKPRRPTHMRGRPRICVEDKLPPNVFKATHMRQSNAYA
ncbi:hypothetical protein PIB30_069103, partial [Stylosanthes scabra]|nr:hypothetical protein [Stylosanthes scabra]